MSLSTGGFATVGYETEAERVVVSAPRRGPRSTPEFKR